MSVVCSQACDTEKAIYMLGLAWPSLASKPASIQRSTERTHGNEIFLRCNWSHSLTVCKFCVCITVCSHFGRESNTRRHTHTHTVHIKCIMNSSESEYERCHWKIAIVFMCGIYCAVVVACIMPSCTHRFKYTSMLCGVWKMKIVWARFENIEISS